MGVVVVVELRLTRAKVYELMNLVAPGRPKTREEFVSSIQKVSKLLRVRPKTLMALWPGWENYKW